MDTSIPVTRAPRRSSAIASAIAPLPVPTSRTSASPIAARRARQRSTTTSVSGRGTSTRRSTFRVSRRNPHSPSTYARGSRCSRRATSRSSAFSSFRATFGSQHELRPRDPDHMGDENLGFDVGRLDPDVSQAFGDASHRVPHTCGHAALHPVGEHALGEAFALESFSQPVVVGTELRDVAIVEPSAEGRGAAQRAEQAARARPTLTRTRRRAPGAAPRREAPR